MIIRQVTIPNRDEMGWIHGTKKVIVIWECPTCGKKMGEPHNHHFAEDGEWYDVDIWQNDCGHTTKYKDLKIIEKLFGN
jgi:hypothetical protein